MSNEVNILVFDGSGRKGSFNRKLINTAVPHLEAAGANVTSINIADFDIPIYNGDLEQEEGIPKAVLELKKIIDRHDGYVIASPEYNGGPSGLLKNTIDWVSRPADGESRLQQFSGKTAVLMSASPGRLGGMRGLIMLNTLLWGLGVHVLPDIVSVPNYSEAFDGDKLIDEGAKSAVESSSHKLVKVTQALKK